MIVETIFSTLDENGQPNFAPMGLVWGESTVVVRPFRNTKTCRNLLATRCGVANLSDDILAYVRCALFNATLPYFQAQVIPGIVFRHTCSWREMELISDTGNPERADLHCRIVHEGHQRDFLGFCRASNAVIESTILATRRSFFHPEALEERLQHYRDIVERTGGAREMEAFQIIHDFVRRGVQ